MALSICCATARPARAAAVLAGLRGVADEIVVAVNVSGEEQDLTALAALADRLFEIELGTHIETGLAWLHAQCSADWILRVDDDEILSAGLLEQLPELTRARDVVQYWLARRWLYPDPGRWLEQWPWFPDFQGRLVRNDARLWFPGRSDTGVAFCRPARYLDEGLYHLVNLAADRSERESGSDPHLSSCYPPERHPGARTAAVDPRDSAAIGAALAPAGPSDAAGVATQRGQLVARKEVEAHWAGREVDEGAYRASIRAVDVHRRLIAGDHRPFRVCVRNEGTELWPGGENRDPLIRVAYCWLSPPGDVLEREGIRTPLPHPVAPGESCLVAMNVIAPANPGPYLLAPDLVHEYVRWFQCRSSPVEMLITAPGAPPR